MLVAIAAARAKALAALERENNECRKLARQKGRTHYVFGRGSADASIMLIGEAPGFEEDHIGLPFVGRAGKLLDRLLAAADIDAGNVYITNVVKFRPMRDPQEPGKPHNDRPPDKREITSCLPVLEHQIEILHPAIICTLGNTPLRALLNITTGVGQLHGTIMRYRDIKVIPTYHPAVVFRNPALRDVLLKDLTKVGKALG
jgi:DNA polymerase